MRQQGNGSGTITKTLFQKTMLTMLVAELTGAVTAIIDAILIGRYLGAADLASFGLGGPYFSIASIVSGTLLMGSTSRCTRAVGKGDREELNSVFTLTMFLGVTISVALGVCGVCFAGSFARLFGAGNASPQVFAGTCSYLRGIFIGAPGFILFVILTPILQLDGDALRPRIASAACGVVDVAGDLLVAFVFKNGLWGMALASTASHYVALAITLTHFLKKGSMFRFSLPRLRIKEAPALLSDGMPRAVCMFCRATQPILLNVLVLRLMGDLGVTALSAQTSSSFVLGALGWGIGGAVLMMGGMMAGEQNVSGMKSVAGSALWDIAVWVTGFAALYFALSPVLAALYIPQPGPLRDMAVEAHRWYAVCLPFLALNVAASNYFQSVSRKLDANLVNVGIELALPTAMAYLLSAPLGVRGVWMAFPAGQLALTLVIAVRILLSRDRNRTGAAAYMLLPEGFGVPPQDCLERSLHTMEEVVSFSREVSAFCIAHGAGGRSANRLALCVEEMAGNVIEHGFSDGKPHRMEVRVLVKEGQYTLRIRDDCALFDLKEKADHWAPDPEHPESNIGIRLILASCSDINYSCAMNTNNLIITI